MTELNERSQLFEDKPFLLSTDACWETGAGLRRIDLDQRERQMICFSATFLRAACWYLCHFVFSVTVSRKRKHDFNPKGKQEQKYFEDTICSRRRVSAVGSDPSAGFNSH